MAASKQLRFLDYDCLLLEDGTLEIESYSPEGGETEALPEPFVVPARLGGYRVTSIGPHAFSYEFADTDGITLIEPKAFFCWDCPSPKLVGKKGSCAEAHAEGRYQFEDFDWNPCSDYSIRNGMLERYTGWYRKAEVPMGVTEIGPQAFCGRKGVYTVTLPESVKRIHEGAFAGCCALGVVTLPDGLLPIPRSAFKGCPDVVFLDTSRNEITPCWETE